MPLDPSAKRLLDLLSAGRVDETGGRDITSRRKTFCDLLRVAGMPGPSTVSVRDEAISSRGGSLRLRLYAPPATINTSSPALLFFHGGGFCSGSVETHDGLCRTLADASACRVVSVDYRLAPEHPFPAAIEDGLTTLNALTKMASRWGIDRSRVAIGGDSVGANVAAVICQQWRRTAKLPLAAQFLLCPALDAIGDTPSRKMFAKGYYLESQMIVNDFSRYCASHVAQDSELVSPLRSSDLFGLPHSIIHAAEYDPLRDDAVRYEQALRRSGVSTSLKCHSGMIHLFYAFGRLIPEGGHALAAIGKEIGKFLCRA